MSKKSSQLSVTLTPEQVRHIRSEAQRTGQSESQITRSLVEAGLQKAPILPVAIDRGTLAWLHERAHATRATAERVAYDFITVGRECVTDRPASPHTAHYHTVLHGAVEPFLRAFFGDPQTPTHRNDLLARFLEAAIAERGWEAVYAPARGRVPAAPTRDEVTEAEGRPVEKVSFWEVVSDRMREVAEVTGADRVALLKTTRQIVEDAWVAAAQAKERAVRATLDHHALAKADLLYTHHAQAHRRGVPLDGGAPRPVAQAMYDALEARRTAEG